MRHQQFFSLKKGIMLFAAIITLVGINSSAQYTGIKAFAQLPSILPQTSLTQPNASTSYQQINNPQAVSSQALTQNRAAEVVNSNAPARNVAHLTQPDENTGFASSRKTNQKNVYRQVAAAVPNDSGATHISFSQLPKQESEAEKPTANQSVPQTENSVQNIPNRKIENPQQLPKQSESQAVQQVAEENDEELLDWQLEHGMVLPYQNYFVDSKIIGAVRYQADFSLETSYDIMRELANLQKDLKQYLALGQPLETIEVFIFQSEDKYMKFLAVEFPEAPYDRRALYVKQDGPGMVLIFRSQNMYEDMRHELTHAFLHASIKYIPLWLDEGIAEYFEKPRETRAVTNPYFATTTKKIKFGSVPSLSKLQKIVRFDDLGAIEYCDSWSWVHFMMHYSRTTHELLAGYLQLLQKYGKATPPIENYLSKSVPDLKQKYIEHFRNWEVRAAAKQPKKTDLSQAVQQQNVEPVQEKPKSEQRFSRIWTDSLWR